MGTILAGAAMAALAGCGGGATTATNNAVGNDVYVAPDDLGANDLLLNESDLNALGPSEPANGAADNGASTNAAGNPL
ncbi:MAG: hypothetical protein AB7O91_11640 [Sphingomonas sp.]